MADTQNNKPSMSTPIKYELTSQRSVNNPIRPSMQRLEDTAERGRGGRPSSSRVNSGGAPMSVAQVANIASRSEPRTPTQTSIPVFKDNTANQNRKRRSRLSLANTRRKPRAARKLEFTPAVRRFMTEQLPPNAERRLVRRALETKFGKVRIPSASPPNNSKALTVYVKPKSPEKRKVTRPTRINEPESPEIPRISDGKASPSSDEKGKTYVVANVAKKFMKKSLVPKAGRELVNKTRPPSNKSKSLTAVKKPSKTIVLRNSPKTPNAVSSSSSENVPVVTTKTQSRVFNHEGKVKEEVSNIQRRFESVFDGVTGDGETIKLNTSDYQKQLNKLQTLIESLDKKLNRKKMEKKSLAVYKKKLNALLNDVSKLKLVIAKRSSPKTMTTSTQTLPLTTTTSTQTSTPKKTPSPKPAIIQPLVTNQSVNKIVKAITERNAKVPTTPPGVTKTNLQKFLAPFKQPVSIKFAPSIQATGGTGGNATIIQTKNKKNDDKKKKKPFKKFDVLADPASAYRKSVVASKRKEIMTRLRTPTVGQRKKHVIQLIDKELRLMKVPKDIERKMISLYSKALSEKQIKQLFGGRSAGDVKKILKKQVDYFKKKKR